MKAIWNETVIAQSDETIVVENNQYFPPNSVNMEFLVKSKTETTCPWKGQASYYNIIVGNEINTNAAWFYKNPKPMAKNINNHIAFWKGVKVIK